MIPPKTPRTAASPVSISLSKVLLVEGDTPLHFFQALLRHLGLQDEIEIRNFGGIKDLKAVLTALVATSEFKKLVTSVGVIRDAEENRNAAFESANHAFAAAELTKDLTPDVQTSTFILPDDKNPGMLETLCIDSIRNQPVFPCVEEFFVCVEKVELDVPQGIGQSKAFAQAYLATRKDVQLYPGLAAYYGYWPWNIPVFESLKQFLQSL